MLATHPTELTINGIKYLVEITKDNEIILRRYRADYKMWVTVSYSNAKDDIIDKNIKNLLKNQFLIQIKRDILRN